MKKGAFSRGGFPKVFMDRFGQHVTGFISGFDAQCRSARLAFQTHQVPSTVPT